MEGIFSTLEASLTVALQWSGGEEEASGIKDLTRRRHEASWGIGVDKLQSLSWFPLFRHMYILIISSIAYGSPCGPNDIWQTNHELVRGEEAVWVGE